MQNLADFGEAWGLLPSSSAVTFTDNHDTQRSATNVLTYKDGVYYNLANYFMLAHPYGHPKVMSSYYFTDDDAGPPSSSVHSSSASVDCGGGSTWVCEHRRGGIANMVKFRLATSAAANNATTNSKAKQTKKDGSGDSVDVAYWYADPSNGNRASFGFTTGTGFFAVNMDTNDAWQGHSFDTGMPDGSYCNAITDQDYFDASITKDKINASRKHGAMAAAVGSFRPVLSSGDNECDDGSAPIVVSGGQAAFDVPSLGAVAFYDDGSA